MAVEDAREFSAEAMGTPAELFTLQHGERVVYGNEWVRVTRVDITPPDGRRFEHHVVRLQRVAMALVIDDLDHVLMLWRYRFAVNAWGWEIPGGIAADGEDAASAAERECVEETGWRSGALTKLAEFQPMPGMVDTPHEVFLARSALKVGEPTDAEEAALIRWVPLDVVPQLIQRGLVLGAGSLVALLSVVGVERQANPA